MADVDEIWREMQQEQPSSISRRPAMKAVKDLSLLQREKPKTKKASKASAKQLDSTLNWMQTWSSGLTLGHQQEFGSSAGGIAEDLSVSEPPTTLLDAWADLPTGTPETFLAYIQRDINCLAEETLSVRLQSLQKLERILVQQADSLSTDIVDAVLDVMLKPLLKRLKDKSEKCRELSAKILRSLVENTSDLAAALPYVFPTLVSRLGSEDLEGVAHLPEIMRPDPEQKPQEIARPVEESEEVRLELGAFVASLLRRCSPIQIYSYVDEATGLIRAQAMDPFHEVKALACETMIAFCYNNAQMLLHFALPLARSLTSCLTHNHARLRIAALKAITACLFCGVWKHNFEIFEVLMAWQDPNKVPIKAFYEGVTNVNYMSTLSFDRHPAVRRFWFETLGYWMLRCVDKVDLEPYIAPYLLTGLCDENEEIALEVFWLIEKIGEAYEAEHEEDLRKTKQYGFDYTWTYGGRAFVPFPLQGVWGGGRSVPKHIRRTGAQGPDFLGQRALPDHRHREQLDSLEEEASEASEDAEDEEDPAARQLGRPAELPSRDYCWPDFRDLAVYRRLPRPRLGSRSWVRTHSRRFIKATFNDVVDFRDCTALNAGRLLCMCLAYTEEGVTEWLQPMMAALIKFYSGRAWAAGDPRAMQTYSAVCKLLGSFLEPASFWAQLRAALEADSTMDLDQRVASVRILAMSLEGHVEVLQSVQPPDPSLGMGQLETVIPDLIDTMHGSDLLLSPTPESREAMWMVLFAFLEPLRRFLTESQVSQLLFISLALASKAPAEELPEPGRAKKGAGALGPQLVDNEELVDPEKLQRALSALSSGLPQAPVSSLDSLDDDLVEAPEASPQQRLFERAFGHVMERVDESFQVFRSVLHLSPVEVLLQDSHQEQLLQHLAAFAGTASAPETRSAAQALGVRLAVRAAQGSGKDLARKVLQLLGASMLQAATGPGYRSLSCPVSLAALASWRRFLLRQEADLALTPPPATDEGSSVLQWLMSTFADQELYKRLHLAMEHAEKVLTGSDQEDWVLEKARHIRLESERQASVLRGAAASTALVALRRGLRTRHRAPWSEGEGRALFLAVASTFGVATHTLEPPFVRPTPPALLLYAAELLHLLLHLPAEPEEEEACAEMASSPFMLLDDAAQGIHSLPAPATAPRLPRRMRLSREEEEQLVSNYIGALMELNLTLPPDPKAKAAPASLEESGKDLALGWDDAILSPGDEAKTSAAAEVSRVLAQSSECQRWNAAYALYILGVDLGAIFKESFESCLARWRKKKEQGKVLLASDVLLRSQKTLGAARG